MQAQNGLVGSVELKGKRFDCGSVQGYAEPFGMSFHIVVKASIK